MLCPSDNGSQGTSSQLLARGSLNATLQQDGRLDLENPCDCFKRPIGHHQSRDDIVV